MYGRVRYLSLFLLVPLFLMAGCDPDPTAVTPPETPLFTLLAPSSQRIGSPRTVRLPYGCLRLLTECG
jgi:hypothetical protein